MQPAFDLDQWAQREGWAAAGVSAPEIPKSVQDYYRQWLKEKKGPQMHYLEKRLLERLDPQKYFEGVKSILCFALYYHPGWAQKTPKISNYAWDSDYHLRLKTKLEQTAEKLKAQIGEFDFRICVDTSPVLEKQLAIQAGLGWQGKNTLILRRGLGSQFFLGEIFTSIPMERFEISLPVSDHCGTCQRCLEACPTRALSPYELDASQCISYWTLEHKGEFTSQTPSWKDWIAGCDICQEVCPWNQKLIAIGGPPEPENPQSARTPASALSYVSESSWNRNLRHIE